MLTANDVQTIFNAVVNLFKIEFTILGFTISLWMLLLWTILGSLLIDAIVGFIGGE